MTIHRRRQYVMTIDEVSGNTSNKDPPFQGRGLATGDGSAEIKVHPKLLEVLASLENPEGIFALGDIDQEYARVNEGNSDKTKLMILGVMYSPSAQYYHHTPGSGLTWNQFVRMGRPTKIIVRQDQEISKYSRKRKK